MIKKPRIIMLSPVNFLRSYSGFQYLADFLYEKGFDVVVYAHIPLKNMPESSKLPYPIFSCYTGVLGKIPKIRHFVYKNIIRKALNKADAVILNTTSPSGYFKECVQFKKKYSEKLFIQYCTEFWMPMENSVYTAEDREFFLKNSNSADLIIDVDPSRALARKDFFLIEKEIKVIPNTLPKNTNININKQIDIRKIDGVRIEENKKIVIYTGQISEASLTEVIEIMTNTNVNVVLIWFAHGDDVLLDEARERIYSINYEQRIYILNPIPRVDLINIMQQADAGLIVYKFSNTNNLNLKYAAPTKLYEYISSGLPIISYGNPSIKTLVDQYDLGICSLQDNPFSLGTKINELFNRVDFNLMKKHVKNVFVNYLCYEKVSKNATDEILQMISKNNLN